MKKSIILILLLLLGTVRIEAFEAKVVGIIDGDTIRVLDSENKMIKIRLYGIDCPEKKQAFGNEAKKFTSSMVFNKDVEIERKDVDRYKRIVANVYKDDKCLNEELVRAGFAWVYPQYYKGTQWYEYQKTAKAERMGLWRDPRPIPPWEFRKNRRKKHGK